jgi:hypothetical protein
MKIDSIYPLPLRGGRERVGVNIQILSPPHLYPLPPRGEEVFCGVFSKYLNKKSLVIEFRTRLF